MNSTTSERWLIGVDVGASETRLRMESLERRKVRWETSRATAHSASSECDPVAIADLIGEAIVETGVAARSVVVTIGVAGLPDVLDAGRVSSSLCGLGLDGFVVAADALTAHIGAVGLEPGASLAAGTGVVGLATDLVNHWHRVDGWGHVLGDDGGGAWIGRRALNAALRSVDGRIGGSRRLLDAALAHFGTVEDIVPATASGGDQAAILAAFVPAVVETAAGGDPAAIEIVDRAAERLAQTVAATAAALPGTTRVAYSGGLFANGEPLVEPLRRHLAALSPAELTPAQGTPLDGAVALARQAATDPQQIPRHPLFIHSSGGQP